VNAPRKPLAIAPHADGLLLREFLAAQRKSNCYATNISASLLRNGTNWAPAGTRIELPETATPGSTLSKEGNRHRKPSRKERIHETHG
jgi:hypothetical protein